MLKQIRLQNFLSFKDLTIDFNSGLNILVGINGAGKSNLFRALDLLKEGVSGKRLKDFVFNKMGGMDNILFKAANANLPDYSTTLKFVFDGKVAGEKGFKFVDDIVYTITLKKLPSSSNYYVLERVESSSGFVWLDFEAGSGVLSEGVENNGQKTKPVKYHDFVSGQELALSSIFDTDRYSALSTIRSAIADMEVYHYFDTTSTSLIRKPTLPTSEERLLPTGTNLPQILNTLKINSKSSFNRIINLLKDINPAFTEIDFNFIGGNIELMLGEENLEGSIHVTNISDGTLHYLCLLAILLNNNRGKVVCIDEPELGLHPDMISGISRLLEEKSPETQFIISTHSENLLDNFDLRDILIFEKDKANSTTVKRYSDDDFKGWYQQFSPGKMWRTGDLGGNRW
ncbi:MAG: AAA family ATPase [Bacteroidetes bacterium]|nr:AAA family ATPase [Bacteroidota bacterium]